MATLQGKGNIRQIKSAALTISKSQGCTCMYVQAMLGHINMPDIRPEGQKAAVSTVC
jgi:hypothetical protein